MNYTKDLKNLVAKTKGLKPAIEGVLFCNDKIVATDSFKLIEIEAEGDLIHIVPLSALKKGDTLSKGDGLNVNIVRTDGSVLTVEALPADDFPQYESILADAEARTKTIIKVSRKHLIDLLTAMEPDAWDALELHVSSEPNMPLLVKGKGCKGLLMPLTK